MERYVDRFIRDNDIDPNDASTEAIRVVHQFFLDAVEVTSLSGDDLGDDEDRQYLIEAVQDLIDEAIRIHAKLLE